MRRLCLVLLAATPLFGQARDRSRVQAASDAMLASQPVFGQHNRAENAGPPLTSSKLMIFGGSDHKTYLGCLNCSETSSDSVLNEYGKYGSPYQRESIINQYSQFGSAYSRFAVCNEFAADPPVIVDSTGKSYGWLSINSAKTTKLEHWAVWIAGVCKRK